MTINKYALLILLTACGGNKTKATHTICTISANGYTLGFAYDNDSSYCSVAEGDVVLASNTGTGVNCGVELDLEAFVAYSADQSWVYVTADGISEGMDFDGCEKIPGELDVSAE